MYKIFLFLLFPLVSSTGFACAAELRAIYERTVDVPASSTHWQSSSDGKSGEVSGYMHNGILELTTNSKPQVTREGQLQLGETLKTAIEHFGAENVNKIRIKLDHQPTSTYAKQTPNAILHQLNETYRRVSKDPDFLSQVAARALSEKEAEALKLKAVWNLTYGKQIKEAWGPCKINVISVSRKANAPEKDWVYAVFEIEKVNIEK